MILLHNGEAMPLRPLPCLFFACALSVIFHSALLWSDLITANAPPTVRPAPLAARLPATASKPSDNDPLLKNTQHPEASKPIDKPPPPARRTSPASKAATPRAVAAAQRKLAPCIYYPPAAVTRGLEGEVRLLLVLDDDGRIREASVAASSGHALLDQAALNAARCMGRIAAPGVSQMILPVSFRLE